jgi:hypothetical protein
MQFMVVPQGMLDGLGPVGTEAVTNFDSTDYGCDPANPYCPPPGGDYWRLGVVTTVYTDLATNDAYMTGLAAHEIGHTVNLADCNGCDINATVMSSFTHDLNNPAGLQGPSFCDNLQVGQSDVALLRFRYIFQPGSRWAVAKENKWKVPAAPTACWVKRQAP